MSIYDPLPRPDLPLELRQVIRRSELFRQSLPSRRLYKYTDLEFAKELVELGQVRIGTIDEFRRQENPDDIRRDTGDATATFVELIQHANERSLSPFARTAISLPPDASDIVFNRCVVERREVHPNAYAYCTSSELSHTAADRYTGCVEIINPLGFFDSLHKALCEALGIPPKGQFEIGPVYYAGLSVDHRLWDIVPPAFIKDKARHEREREVRAVWHAPLPPSDGPHARWCDVTAPAICPFVRLIDIPN